MSGGVDSSVAAALLKEQGYQVIGVTMQVWPSGGSADERFGGCCGIGAIADAQRVAQELDIPHYVMNFREVFAQKVIADFCREYSQGRTPNPCIRCNQHVKFGALLQRANELGADFLATGHYARIEQVKDRYVLRKGIDSTKDQSYALYTMTQGQLEHTLMPMGNLTKQRVRQIARDLKLAVAGKSESQEICFIPDNNYRRFLEEHMPQRARSGPVTDREGNILGGHRGIIHYTVGQRRGLGISAGEPLYVLVIDSDRNAVVVGSRGEVFGSELVAAEVNWTSIEKPTRPIAVEAKIRYLHKQAVALVAPMGNGEAHVRFEQPQMAIAPGQAVVFYQGDVVVGGGTIEQTERKSDGQDNCGLPQRCEGHQEGTR
ncbi:MAG: tRNA-specific 2-thiouridylase MnmA [Chloroflexi bacterium]|nr:tRNA-specific 2-thiouridylase MnmA [Chloroflexota bacterium]